MAAGKGEKNDFYAVLGVQKECTDDELRNAYKKLALKWHPDRCSALGNLKRVEEAKKKFQDIQEAYSVLSDANKRFIYDVGYEGEEDDGNGMGDFLNEMADMMCQHKSSGGGNESFEELQDLFDEMFQNERGSVNSDEHGHGHGHEWWPSSYSSSSKNSSNDAAAVTSETATTTTTSSTKTKLGKSTSFDAHFDAFNFGVQVQNWMGAGRGEGSKGLAGRE